MKRTKIDPDFIDNYNINSPTKQKKTIYFEDHYNVNIDDFKTTKEIDEFIENQTGKKLEIVKIKNNLL